MKLTTKNTEQLQVLLEVVKAVKEMRYQQIDWVAVAADDRTIMLEMENREVKEEEDEFPQSD